MTPVSPTFLQLTLMLTDSLRQETMLARTGALAHLKQAALAKQAAFKAFSDACDAREALASTAETQHELERDPSSMGNTNPNSIQSGKLTSKQNSGPCAIFWWQRMKAPWCWRR